MKNFLNVKLFIIICLAIAVFFAYKNLHYKIKDNFAALTGLSLSQIPERDIYPDGSTKITFPAPQRKNHYAGLLKSAQDAAQKIKQLLKPLLPAKGNMVINNGTCVIQTPDGKTKDCPQ
jgi:hypothetical protein